MLYLLNHCLETLENIYIAVEIVETDLTSILFKLI